MSTATPAKPRTCGVCGAAYERHSGDLCPYCRCPIEHHDPDEAAACRAGRLRMAEARAAAGSHLDAVDRVVLGLPPVTVELDDLYPLKAASMPHLGDAPTSAAMRAAAFPRSGTLRAEVVATVHAAEGRGLTDDDLERILTRSHQSVSACRNGLVADGWLRPRTLPNGAALERRNRYDNLAQVWELTPAATAHYLQEHE